MAYYVITNGSNTGRFYVTNTCNKPRIAVKHGTSTSYLPLKTTTSTYSTKVTYTNTTGASFLTSSTLGNTYYSWSTVQYFNYKQSYTYNIVRIAGTGYIRESTNYKSINIGSYTFIYNYNNNYQNLTTVQTSSGIKADGGAYLQKLSTYYGSSANYNATILCTDKTQAYVTTTGTGGNGWAGTTTVYRTETMVSGGWISVYVSSYSQSSRFDYSYNVYTSVTGTSYQTRTTTTQIKMTCDTWQ